MNEATCKDSNTAAGEATEPEWFEYIRVQERKILGSDKPSDFLISFGPRNICSPQKDEQRAERLVKNIKSWLLMWINKSVASPTAAAGTGEEEFEDWWALSPYANNYSHTLVARAAWNAARNDAPIEGGTWPAKSLHRTFVDGMKWWQFHHGGATAFPSERDEAEAEALRRYGAVEGGTAELPAWVASLKAVALDLKNCEAMCYSHEYFVLQEKLRIAASPDVILRLISLLANGRGTK